MLLLTAFIFLVVIASKHVNSSSPQSSNRPITIRSDVAPEAAEVDFLLQKVMGFRQQVASYNIALAESAALSEKLTTLNQELMNEKSLLTQSAAQLREENQRLVAQLSQWSSRKHQIQHNATVLSESFVALSAFASELEVKVQNLENDKESLQRSLDLLSLLCLAINVIVLVIAGWEHFVPANLNVSSWFVRQGSLLFTSSAESSRLNWYKGTIIVQLQVISAYGTDVYRKVFSAVSHLIVIMA